MATSTTSQATVLAPVRRRGGSELESDVQLVEGVRDGDESAFEAIFDRYHRRILSFCRHMLGSQEDGEDATQQVFVAAHADLVKSARDVQLRPWLFAIARNRCLDMLRARRATDSLDAIDHEPASLEGLPEAVQRREDLRALVSDIGELPADQRAALVLFELGGLPQRQLADVLDCRPEQVKALVYQARVSLMADREARDAECRGIREEIAAGRGHDLLRSHLRRHLRVCPACREFADDTRHQRAALALVLPVLPTAGLKASTLAAAGAAGAAAAPTGGALAGGFGTLIGKGMALKALAILCVAGAAGGIGYTIVHRAATAPPAAAGNERPLAGAAAAYKNATTGTPTGAAAGHAALATTGTIHSTRRTAGALPGRRHHARHATRHSAQISTPGRHGRGHRGRFGTPTHATAHPAPSGSGSVRPAAPGPAARPPATSGGGATHPAAAPVAAPPPRHHRVHPRHPVHPVHPQHPAHPVAPPPAAPAPAPTPPPPSPADQTGRDHHHDGQQGQDGQGQSQDGQGQGHDGQGGQGNGDHHGG